MNLVEHDIGASYRVEVRAITIRMHDNKLQAEAVIKRYAGAFGAVGRSSTENLFFERNNYFQTIHPADMLDARAVRIQKLETQLHNVAIGRRGRRIETMPLVGGTPMVRPPPRRPSSSSSSRRRRSPTRRRRGSNPATIWWS